MYRTRRALVLMTQALFLFGVGCDVPPDGSEKVQDTTVVTAALNDSFTSISPGFLATAVTTDRVFNVWIGRTSVGVQIVGQMFSLTGAPLGPSRVYTNTAHNKFSPSVAYGSGGKFLIAFQDEYAASDNDILGIIVDHNGVLVSTTNIDFSSNYEREPRVTYVPTGINKWLVTYERNATATVGNALLTSFVDVAGVVGPSANIWSSFQDFPTEAQAQYSIPTGRIMFAWSSSAGLSFRFTSTAFALGPVGTFPAAANHIFGHPSLAFQPNTEGMAVAWLEEEPLVDTNKTIRFRSLWRACESVACAKAEQPTGITKSAAITDLQAPHLSALGQLFVIHNGQTGASLTNGQSVRFTAMNDSGVVTASSNQFVSSCASSRTDLLGHYDIFGPKLVAASNETADRTSIIYDSYCPSTSSVLGQIETAAFARSSYLVSD